MVAGRRSVGAGTLEGHMVGADKSFQVPVVMWADLKERKPFTFSMCLFHGIFREAIAESEFLSQAFS